jgi:hydrogenase-4 component E
MFASIYPQTIGLCAGTLLLTSALMVWRHSLLASIGLLAAQGVGLAALVAVIGAQAGDTELLLVAILVLAVKGAALPWILARQTGSTTRTIDESPRLNPTASLLLVAGLTILSYVVLGRILVHLDTVTAHAAPIGLAMVLIGFLLLVTRRRARSQLIGFLLLDNGIATVAFLTSGGVPLFLELGISLDVLLVVVILYVFAGRMHTKFGGADVDTLRELHD